MKFIQKTIANIRKEPDQHLLMLLLFVLPFERIPSVSMLGITVRMSLIVGVIIILRVLYLLYKKQLTFKLITPYKILAVFLVWIVIIIPESINIKRAVQVVAYNSYAITLAVAISLLYKKKYLQPMLIALLSGAIAVSIFGLYQYFGDAFGVPLRYTGLRERYSNELFGFPRVQSTSLEPLYFASYLLMPASIVAALVLTGTKLRHFGAKATASILVLFGLLIFLTVSRGAIYGLVAMSVFMVGLVMYKRLSSLKRVGIYIAALLLAFGLSWVLINYLNTNPSELFSKKRGAAVYSDQITKTTLQDPGDERSIARANAINILKTEKLSILIGIGPGQYGPYIMNNQPDENGWTIVNNETLELILELGMIGFIIIVVFIGYIFIQGLRIVPSKDPLVTVATIGLLGYLVAEAVQYQSFSTLYITHIWVAIGLLIGLTRVASEEKR